MGAGAGQDAELRAPGCFNTGVLCHRNGSRRPAWRGGNVPRIVDHDARRGELVAAALRVITTEGFAAASVRRVAHEAGCSAGALRHYFPRHDALVAAVLDEVTRAAAARLIPRIRAQRADGHQ